MKVPRRVAAAQIDKQVSGGTGPPRFGPKAAGQGLDPATSANRLMAKVLAVEPRQKAARLPRRL